MGAGSVTSEIRPEEFSRYLEIVINELYPNNIMRGEFR
jgi:hypothetical protein